MLPILSAGIAPGLALLCYFYLRDRYESEPVIMVARAFLYGVLITFPVMFLQYVIEEEQLLSDGFLQAFVSTAMLEEFMKWFILYYLIYRHTHFDEPYDGIVYATSVSLGFATAENVLYLAAHGVEYAFLRALLPVSSHALFGVIMGYYFGRAKFGKVQFEKKMLSLAFIIVFLLHGSFDYILFIDSVWIYYVIPFMLFLWWFALRKVKKAHILTEAYHRAKM
ncbi:glutamic-type intramembrane protease PrsW [Domibacillus epiphyticus]|uniref:Protease PrsW n=1 Tax=Domibacillus epiphyticus TaxID=1714355 RepID=A0A1V2A512_9BACI|nr:glutamic-type intramembrane protease PrsW [Domibacillus epiphyticus]OMP65942.1 protease PrsW [Domibacillus epiphyticus]